MEPEENAAFLDELILHNYSIMLEYADHFFNNRDVAEDAVQDTFLLAQIKIDELLNSPNPAGWLMNTLKNIIGDLYRRRKKVMELCTPLEDSLATTAFSINPRLEYEGIISRQELDLLFWIYCDGLSYKEVSDKLGIGLSACKKRIQRAKIRFRQAMENEGL